MKVISRKNLSEKDFMGIVKNDPREMRNRWRGRLRKSAEELSKEKDPVKRAKMEKMFYLQKKHLKKWEDKVR